MPDNAGAAPPRQHPGVHAYAVRDSGVHGVPLEQAVEWVRGGGPAGEAAPLVWVDISTPGEAEAAFLRERLGFHPLAVEDSLRGRQRPKLDRYPGYFFLVLYAAQINAERERVALHELHLFLGPRYLVSVHDRKIRQVTETLARWRGAPSRFADVGALAHGLVDAVVDEYVPVLDHFAERAERIESTVFGAPAEEGMQGILALRREMVRFRRVVAPSREVFATLLRRDLPLIRPELLPYFQDVHDHVIRVTEEVDSLRDLLSAALDAHLSTASNQLNQTVRMMTAWSIILMSMTLIAGIYGMNFVLMPELGWRYGYPLALVLMLGVGLGLIAFFRGKRWI